MNKTYYGGFYGLDSAPFHITPDPSRLFLTLTHQHALGAIEYGITAGKGFIVVTGEVGVGKTTVLRNCLDRLDTKTTRIIYLFNPALSTAELYATILDELDGKRRRLPAHPSETLQTLQRKLLAAYTVGKHIVLAVDEAQNMPEGTLESLRMLSNLETSQSKLLQIVLVGQPELESLLARHSLRQLRQRVAVRARIRRLSFRQSCQYIEYRTRSAGFSTTRALFTAPAQWYIAIVARGVPRTINICCDNALINGYGHAARRISLRIAREACSPLGYHLPIGRVLGLAAALMVVVGGLIYGNALLR